MSVTPEQFDEWKEHPTTKIVFTEIRALRDHLMAELSEGRTLGQHADITHGLTSRLVGNIAGLNQLLNITFEEN